MVLYARHSNATGLAMCLYLQLRSYMSGTCLSGAQRNRSPDALGATVQARRALHHGYSVAMLRLALPF